MSAPPREHDGVVDLAAALGAEHDGAGVGEPELGLAPPPPRVLGVRRSAVVEALVDVDGSVADARILKPSRNASLDQAAVDAGMRSKFSPAMQRDKPVRVWVSIPFRFTLTG